MMNFTIFENETTGRESFVDLFTSNIAIIIYIIFIALAIIGIAVLFIVNESLTNEKIQKINTDSTVILDKNGRRIRPNGESEEKSEVEEVAQMFGLKAEEVEELKSKALNKEITVEQFKEKLALKYAMNQLAKKPKVEDNSSEMSIIDENEVELSNKPYGGYFEKYKNKK